MKSHSESYTLYEVAQITGIKESALQAFLEQEWLCLAEEKRKERLLDEEDLARVRFIQELQRDFGANAESIPIILHLVDQLCYFRNCLKRGTENSRLQED